MTESNHKRWHLVATFTVSAVLTNCGTDLAPVPPTRNGIAQSLSLRSAALEMMRGHGVDTRLELVSKGIALGLGGQETAHLFGFAFGGVSICDSQLKAIEVLGQAPITLGSMPSLENLALVKGEWPDVKRAFSLAEAAAPDNGVFAPLVFDSSERCYINRAGTLTPVADMSVTAGNLGYRVVVGADSVYRFEPRFFDVDGKSRVYSPNKLDAKLTEFTLKGLTGDGSLTSQYFATTFDSTKYTRAKNAEHNFFYTPGISDFDETSVFTNASRTLEWFQTIGYSEFGPKVIKLVVHAILGGSGNNALYNPATATAPPFIFVGDGDGILLQNLTTDQDVVGHEFGHHVVYATVTNVSGQSLVLHEGLADFFTFARTGDSCLGESICPKASAIHCAIEAKCLRTAENDLKFGGADLPVEEHFRSQFISGMLWDLISKDLIPVADVSKLVLTAVSYLVADSGYKHLVLALMIADKNLYAGANCSKIFARATTRGLGTLIASFKCGEALPSIATLTNDEPAAQPVAVSNKSKGGSGPCGVVSGGSATVPGVLSLLLCLFPLAAVWPVRSRR